MSSDLFLRFRPYKYFPVWLQILMLGALFIVTIVVFQFIGTVQGMPLHPTTYIAPIYEELLFRGFILGHLLRRLSPWKAVALSSLLFGLWHLKNLAFIGAPEVLLQVAVTGLVVGSVLAVITFKMRSIWPALMVHFLWNLVAVWL